MAIGQNLNPHFLGHLEGLRERSLRFPFCTVCRRFHWYPMPRCAHCREPSWIWQQIGGRAEVYSWTVVRYPFAPEFSEQLPYVVALMTFAEAPEVRLVTNLIETPLEQISIGMAVDPVFDPAGALVQFRPAR